MSKAAATQSSGTRLKSTTQKFYTANCTGPPVPGCRGCKALVLIKVESAVPSEQKSSAQSDDIVREHADLFKETFPGECSFRMDPQVSPVVCPLRMVPFALREHPTIE